MHLAVRLLDGKPQVVFLRATNPSTSYGKTPAGRSPPKINAWRATETALSAASTTPSTGSPCCYLLARSGQAPCCRWVGTLREALILLPSARLRTSSAHPSLSDRFCSGWRTTWRICLILI